MTVSGLSPLTFLQLDGLAFAAERGKLHGRDLSKALIADTLGPAIELMHLSADGLLPTTDWLDFGTLARFWKAIHEKAEKWICPATRLCGFLRTSIDDEHLWVAFGLAAQQAAVVAGFPRAIAAQLVGAIGEMRSNIYEHSNEASSGLVAFRASPGNFEFAVDDHGAGLLKTLKSCPEFTHLSDHGDALRLALTDGISRFGSTSNRGKGFRPLFVGLANLSGTLRFRSGNHALLIDGRTPSLVSAKIAEKPAISGFLASVACKVASSARA